jgi:hypothetical protein
LNGKHGPRTRLSAQAQIQAYRLTDNQLALNAGWDRELLGLELGELKLGGFNLALTGFGELELGDLLADRTAGLTDPDDAPEAPEHPVSRAGDLWLLGRHGLLCGERTVDLAYLLLPRDGRFQALDRSVLRPPHPGARARSVARCSRCMEPRGCLAQYDPDDDRSFGD